MKRSPADEAEFFIPGRSGAFVLDAARLRAHQVGRNVVGFILLAGHADLAIQMALRYGFLAPALGGRR